MTADNARIARPGFQGSETSRCLVSIYPHGNDPILVDAQSDAIELIGKNERDSNLSLISCSTQKSIGGSAGSFAFTVKQPLNHPFDLARAITDDDWVDITFTRHGRPFHVMRGLIDNIMPEVRVENGATVRETTIMGRDFQKVFEQTVVWFNRYIGENAVGGAALQAFAANGDIFGDVATTVRAFLFSFLDVLNNSGTAVWELPPNMPGVFSGNLIRDAVLIDTDGYTNNPKRFSYNAWQISPDGENIWQLAQEWSDPQFCELWCDLLNGDDAIIGANEELEPRRSRMGVILRDRPFPTNAFGPAKDSPYFQLPLSIVDRQEVVSSGMQLSGEERLNAFIVKPIIQAEYANQTVDLDAPLWHVQSIRRHGFRQHVVTSRYCADEGEGGILSMTQTQREAVRDWFCLNAYLRSGEMQLARGRPDIRVGHRVRVPGASEASDETYYCESVQHSWQFRQGLRTSLGLTRGFVGTDQDLLDALFRESSQYTVASAARAGEPLVDVVGNIA